ncbi:unnamed protein product [Phytophthora lilii]|uniref:Unnamed protein product n=1 Tax=Phytophthora lilii TaxID=2077276 RepID=A0A9W6WZB9_9STRA|nr:unnamed protein product [Phytophthora lilii]
MQINYLLVAAATIIELVVAGQDDTSPLPTVTLDYSTIQAIAGNTTIGYYKFQNIRYAKPPTGDLRFAAPQWPDVETEINSGNLPTRTSTARPLKTACSWTCGPLSMPPIATSPFSSTTLAVGSKLGSKSVNTPEGLFELSTDFIYVSYNYRLGLTGVATDPTYQHEGGVSNLAVWDATHAFEWVQKYISDFGGNSGDVTAVGFSAGGSQIAFQMTRFGGNAPQLFQKAYIMSPGYLPSAGHHQPEQFWQNVSTAVGCDGRHLDCMRMVPFAALPNATTRIVSAYSYTLQPRVDGFILPDTYEASVYQGHFNFTGPCVLTHEQHEFNTVAYTGVESEEDIYTTFRVLFPGMTDDAIQKVLELYPAEGYASPGLRFNDMQQSAQVSSKNLALTYALNNETWNGEVVPTNDSTVTLTSEAAALAALASSITSPVDTTIAKQLQNYLLSFVLTGDPNFVWPDDKPYWPQYNESTNGAEIVFNDTFTVVDDDLANAKSLYWNKALWY